MITIVTGVHWGTKPRKLPDPDGMIARIAKALARQQVSDNHFFSVEPDATDEDLEGFWTWFVDDAVEVLQAMREPTIPMIFECADVPWSQQDVWHRSIDEALREMPADD